jgi:hypothetical protein
MQSAICKGRSCRTGWVWINVLLIGKPPPPISDRLSDVLWTRVVVATVNSIWDVGGQEMKLWGQALLLLSSSSKDFLRGGKPPPPKKVECLLRLPSIFGKEKSPMQKKGGRGSSTPAHSQFCLLPPLLTSQTRAGVFVPTWTLIAVKL